MPSVEPYETAKGKRYRVLYRTPDRRQTSKRGFRTKRDAELFLASVEVKIATGEFIEASAGKITIGELAGPWLVGRKPVIKSSAWRVDEITWRLHVEPTWGNKAIADVRHSDVQAWVSGLAAKRSATVTLRAYGILAALLDVAVKDRRAPRNVARGVNLPRKKKKPHVYLTHIEVEALAKEAGAHGTMVRFLAYTGLRWGEAVGLKVEHLDMLRRRIQVAENAVNVAGTIEVGTPKSHKIRSVPFPAFLADDLAVLCAEKSRDMLVFGNGLDHERTPSHRDGWYHYAKERSGVPSKLTIHDLRHTAASLAVASGANVKAVQRMLGHASAAMTLDVYADLFDDDLDTVAVALDRARADSFVANPLPQTAVSRAGSGGSAVKSRAVAAFVAVPPVGLEPTLGRV